jgi:hypothetical protein
MASPAGNQFTMAVWIRIRFAAHGPAVFRAPHTEKCGLAPPLDR